MTFKESVHKLNGSVRYCGVPKLARAVDKLNARATSGSSIEGALNELNGEIDALLAWHREHPNPFGARGQSTSGS